MTDNVLGQRAHRSRLVANAGPDRAGVVDAGKENGAEYDPEERRKPAPDDRDRRPDDRRRAGHRGEVMAPENELVRGHEVDAVLHRVRRRLEVRIEAEDSLGDELRIENIAQSEGSQTDDCQNDSAHGIHLPVALLCFLLDAMRSALNYMRPVPARAPHGTDARRFIDQNERMAFALSCKGPSRAYSLPGEPPRHTKPAHPSHAGGSSMSSLIALLAFLLDRPANEPN